MGRPVDVRIEVRNASSMAVWMVGVVDGSENGIRFPHYRPSVAHGGVVVAEPSVPEDPLVGPLRAVDFQHLGPGEAFDPTRPDGNAAYLPLATFTTFAPPRPGLYRYALTLSTESRDAEEWLGRFNQDAERAAVLELVARVQRVTVAAAVDVHVG